MSEVILNGKVVSDDWTWIESETEWKNRSSQSKCFVPFKVWQSIRSEVLNTENTFIGVQLETSDEPETIANDLKHLQLISIHFAEFKDGRGFSLARLLRERFHFTAELRAVGDILRDQIFYLHRCGFNSFVPRNDQPMEACIAALKDFTETYQAAVDVPEPLFRRLKINS
ncbi:MAG: DUF934 domain-containing protein [Pseudomonadota bacterium]